MEVRVNGQLYDVPFDLSQIKLGKFLDYHEQYGRDLDTKLAESLAKVYNDEAESNELDRTIDIDNHIDNEALAWFSFWTEHDLFEVKDNPEILLLLHQYRVLRFALNESMEAAYDFPLSINWKDEEWEIIDFKVTPVGTMTFNEIITSKEVIRQLHKVSKGKWDALPYLCAVFFRKKGEQFSDELVHEDGDRMELLKELPLDHAMQVAFFLSICVSTWKKTLASSASREEVIASLK